MLTKTLLALLVFSGLMINHAHSSDDALCYGAYMSGPGNQSYPVTTNRIDDGEFGAIGTTGYVDDLFVGWFKGPLAANPFLAGRSKAGLVDGKAYGIVTGERFGGIAGFKSGDLVEVRGSIAAKTVQVRSLSTDNYLNYAITTPEFNVWKGNDCTVHSSSVAIRRQSYDINMIETDAGGVKRNNRYNTDFEFVMSSAWSHHPRVISGKMVSTSPLFGITGPVLVAPLGDAIAVIEVSPNTGASKVLVLNAGWQNKDAIKSSNFNFKPTNSVAMAAPPKPVAVVHEAPVVVSPPIQKTAAEFVAPKAAPIDAPWNGGSWVEVRFGGCDVQDVRRSKQAIPDEDFCTAQLNGKVAVCNADNGGCFYKNVTPRQCKDGSRPGRMYVCTPS